MPGLTPRRVAGGSEHRSTERAHVIPCARRGVPDIAYEEQADEPDRARHRSGERFALRLDGIKKT